MKKSESEIKKTVNQFEATNLFNRAIFGSNTTIVVGHHNVQTAAFKSVSGDFSELSAALKKIGIPEEDIQNLEQAIKDDEKSGAKPSLSGYVGKWFANLMMKAVDKTIDVSAEQVTTSVIQLITTYIAMHTGG